MVNQVLPRAFTEAAEKCWQSYTDKMHASDIKLVMFAALDEGSENVGWLVFYVGPRKLMMSAQFKASYDGRGWTAKRGDVKHGLPTVPETASAAVA